jgi:hypothetical protein
MPDLPYACAIENADDCSIAPSPKDQVHVAPSTLELTLKTSGTPVVALPDTFRKETAKAGAGGDVGVPALTTRVCAESVPTDAVTSAVSLAVNVVNAMPLTPVAACPGEIVPRVVAKVTTTFGNATPFPF